MNYVAGPVLAVLAIIDVKKKKIPVGPVLIMGVILLLIRLSSNLTAGEFVCGLLPGVVFLAIAWMTKEKIGVGDGLLMLCLGMGYRVEQMMAITGIALLVAAMFSMILIVLKKANRKTALPFLPFLFVGWMVSLLV